MQSANRSGSPATGIFLAFFEFIAIKNISISTVSVFYLQIQFFRYVHYLLKCITNYWLCDLKPTFRIFSSRTYLAFIYLPVWIQPASVTWEITPHVEYYGLSFNLHIVIQYCTLEPSSRSVLFFNINSTVQYINTLVPYPNILYSMARINIPYTSYWES